jgi:hypothetical protein
MPTSWKFWLILVTATSAFVAPTSQGRLLKIIFIYRDGCVHLRSAYEAEQLSQDIYKRKAR